MRHWLRIALTLSILANVFLVYRTFDMGVTTTHMSAESEHQQQRAADVEKLLPLLAPDLTKNELLAAAGKAGVEVIEKQDEGIYVGDLLFTLAGDRVVAVTLH